MLHSMDYLHGKIDATAMVCLGPHEARRNNDHQNGQRQFTADRKEFIKDRYEKERAASVDPARLLAGAINCGSSGQIQMSVRVLASFRARTETEAAIN